MTRMEGMTGMTGKTAKTGAPGPGDASGLESIDVCVCTYRRAHLAQTLRSILAQRAPELALRVIVADNDAEPSARALVEAIAAEAPETPVRYLHAPSRNICIARNACLDAATGAWVAFLDDDETAPPDWLATLWRAAKRGGWDVAFGPVIARYPENAPEWIREGNYHTSRAPVHGGVVSTGHAGNAMIRWRGGAGERSGPTGERFLLEMGRTGGEDVEFFFRLSRAGFRLGQSEEARVSEAVAPERLSYRWIRRRRFLAGQFHGAHAASSAGPRISVALRRARLLFRSGPKAAYCLVRALAQVGSPPARRCWMIRGGFHAGVCAGAMGIGQGEQY